MTTAAKAKPVEKVEMDEIRRILEHSKAHLSEEEHRKLTAAIETLAFLTSEIEDKRTTIRHLRKILFGSTSEKTRDLLDEDASDEPQDPQEPEPTPPEEAGGGEEKEPEDPTSAAAPDGGTPSKEGQGKRPGHGRNGAEEYVGAEQIEIPHESLKPGDPCPVLNCEGRVYRLADPAVLVRIVGSAPLRGKVIWLERLRCGLCLAVFTAKAPEGVGEEKYDVTAVSMMVILRYGTGFPLNRLEMLQESLGIPLPASTQWDIAAQNVHIFLPVFLELIRQAAQGQVLYNDDTTMKILELMKAARERARLEEESRKSDRTGMFTSGIVSEKDGIRIALFFTGWKHAGENLATVLAEREAKLQAPIQMCDALARNVPKELETILSNCMSHARRQYVDVVESFPQECRFVLETLAEVFGTDARARKEGMSPQERLELHRRESLPLMAKLRLWTWKEIKERRIEPNSGLGKAIRYMRKHWRKLVRFLYVAGAPLTNNLCERILKKAIIHRKNSLFYKTENGAQVGDIYMSLIATCQLAGANPFEYLTELQRHAERVRASPGEWLPWTYRSTLAAIAEAAKG